ncbi:hypothetical protein D9736_02950 [Escherichia sp. E10V10]|nr:hypothetical protein D9736_02950 [Escherichia sp. E10V10]
MSQLNEKRRLLYWKFCRTVRAWPALERLVTTLYRAWIQTLRQFAIKVLSELIKINKICRSAIG